MSIINHTCSAIIPSQKAGSIVQYKIEAIDYLRNVLETSGNYTVKMASNLDFSLYQEKIPLGENITVSGVLSPVTNTSTVKLLIFGVNFNQTLSCILMSDGTFEASFSLLIQATILLLQLRLRHRSLLELIVQNCFFQLLNHLCTLNTQFR